MSLRSVDNFSFCVTIFTTVNFCRWKFWYCVVRVCRVIATITVENVIFSCVSCCDYHKFVAHTTTDCTWIRLNHFCFKSTSFEDSCISISHVFVFFIQTFLCCIKWISILHDKFTPPEKSETRTSFVSEFWLNLI